MELRKKVPGLDKGSILILRKYPVLADTTYEYKRQINLSYHIMSFPNERKLISIFKSFIEKALIPQIRKNESCLLQWNKFSNMMVADSLNYNQLQLYVDTLPNMNIHLFSHTYPHGHNQHNDANINKKKQQISHHQISFGQKKAVSCQKTPEIGEQVDNQASHQQLLLTRNQHNYKSIKLSLDKLLVKLEQDHTAIEKAVEKQNNSHGEKIKRCVQENEVNKKNVINNFGSCRISEQNYYHPIMNTKHRAPFSFSQTQVAPGFSKGYY